MDYNQKRKNNDNACTEKYLKNNNTKLRCPIYDEGYKQKPEP